MTKLELLVHLNKKEAAQVKADSQRQSEPERRRTALERLNEELSSSLFLMERSKIRDFSPAAVIEALRIGLAGTDLAKEVDFIESDSIARIDLTLRVRDVGVRVSLGMLGNYSRGFTVEVGRMLSLADSFR